MMSCRCELSLMSLNSLVGYLGCWRSPQAIVLSVLYRKNHDKQPHPPERDLLCRAQPARAERAGDALRPQAGARTLDRELLARPTHDVLRRAGAPGRGGPADRTTGG